MSAPRESTALNVSEEHATVPELLAEYTVFFQEVVDDVLLFALNEASEREHEKLKGAGHE